MATSGLTSGGSASTTPSRLLFAGEQFTPVRVDGDAAGAAGEQLGAGGVDVADCGEAEAIVIENRGEVAALGDLAATNESEGDHAVHPPWRVACWRARGSAAFDAAVAAPAFQIRERSGQWAVQDVL